MTVTPMVFPGDARTILPMLPDRWVHCCVTSPPYFGLRDYGHGGQIGLEPTPDAYVAEMVAVFREVRRVLRDDGTLWLNLGDSYARNPAKGQHKPGDPGKQAYVYDRGGGRASATAASGLGGKQLLGIPWRVAFALQADGWYLRQDIIWHKPNPMPESVRDRCTKAHEYVFLFSKSERYFYDAEAVKEPAVCPAGTKGAKGSAERAGVPGVNSRPPEYKIYDGFRNKRSVWTVATKPFAGAHFATYPPELIEPCILAGTSERGCCASCAAPWTRIVERAPAVIDKTERNTERGARTGCSGTQTAPAVSRTVGWEPGCRCAAADTVPCRVLDPFYGAGTTGLVASRLGRQTVGIEINPANVALAKERVQ
jgi:DNA modification methylase